MDPVVAASGAPHALSKPAADERAWALKRDWTDTEFQDGAERNRAQLQAFEDVLMGRLRHSCARALGSADCDHTDAGGGCEAGGSSASTAEPDKNVLARVLDPLAAQSGGLEDSVRFLVLDDPEVLGSALDIVGAYLKNYEVDRAAAVIETVLPVCRERGGAWLLKALNHLATVRMKQARPSDALVALRDAEATANASLRGEEEHAEAWEFWETMYRNFGWILSNLDRTEEAIGYIQKAIDVKERIGKSASWFDLWDLGRMKATVALKRREIASIKESQGVVTKALWLHRDVEPSDLVMRAKIWHSVGECSFALGHLAEEADVGKERLAGDPNAPCRSDVAKGHYRKALKCFRESHKLFRKTEGPYNPLTGGEAQAASWTLLKLDEAEEAKSFVLDALEALSKQQSGWGNGDSVDSEAPALAQAMQIVDRILYAHRRTDDREGLIKYFDAAERLCANVCGRLRVSKERADSPVYEKLVSSCSMVMVASGSDDGASRSQQLLRRYMWSSPNTPQAQLCSELLLSLNNGEQGAGANVATDGPGMRAFIEAMAKAAPMPP